ncbi:MAG TPA: succinate--CoA ligase subunit alpha [Candidatus Eisenbacteria bacterium]|uniref:Succinate--CoA ligase [ADP-forming] subunit alpha n=1 Tax=Eiseniibacteriota bacterium TaxID=2212470 RepID=A0A7V2AWD5_UNCEI|nr:succinate--CoA ligase subunit alpha [Candidatus Eisenbacteria bacterium]
MSILVDRDTKLIVQGITGRDGGFHASQMLAYGTKVVGGVTPGKGGQKTEDGIPVFDSMADAVAETGANTSVIYVPAAFAADAICEASDAGCRLVVCISEGLPVRDMVRVLPFIKERGTRLIGPNSPGLISPGRSKVGIMPGNIHAEGSIGVVSRSGTLTYEIVYHLTRAGLGQSTCIGIGGDPIVGTNLLDTMELFAADAETEAVVLIGEIGGNDEEQAARMIKDGYPKKVGVFIAGHSAPPGKRMGHAGAIVSGGTGTAAEKVAAFAAVGVEVADTPAQIVDIMKRLM